MLGSQRLKSLENQREQFLSSRLQAEIEQKAHVLFREHFLNNLNLIIFWVFIFPTCILHFKKYR